MTKELPSPELLRKLLRYEPETGELYWRERTPDMFPRGKQTALHNCSIWNGRFAHKPAFTSTTKWGYRQGSVFNKKLTGHRVAWAIQHGAWPSHEIDHINGVRDDNRLANLRDVTSSENGRNSRKPAHNTSGSVGVSWCESRGKWVAYIRTNGKVVNLGRFSQKVDAIAMRRSAELEHGYHPNHGR
jgi:hypothetical protein